MLFTHLPKALRPAVVPLYTVRPVAATVSREFTMLPAHQPHHHQLVVVPTIITTSMSCFFIQAVASAIAGLLSNSRNQSWSCWIQPPRLSLHRLCLQENLYYYYTPTTTTPVSARTTPPLQCKILQ